MSSGLENAAPGTDREFHIKVLGRTLEHLGVQMYKRRELAIAELVANCWDAGATRVMIEVPEECEYDQDNSEILIQDNGTGMKPDSVQTAYLVIGRNRRQCAGAGAAGRPVLGRKGIGKLAGFGIANVMTVTTVCQREETELTLDVASLTVGDADAPDVPIPGRVREQSDSDDGTSVRLRSLRHVTPIKVAKLREALGRRFSRTIRGEMEIRVNGELVEEPVLDIVTQFPADGGLETVDVPGFGRVRYCYAFSKSVIRSPEMRGFTVYVRGKTAQMPPFYFGVEGTASGQHGTKYLTGFVEADALDDDGAAPDLISTDRQEIDWEASSAAALHAWGDALTREALREWVEKRSDELSNWLLEDDRLRTRIEALESASRKHLEKFLKTLSKVDADKPAAFQLADSLVRAFEYQHFHSVIENLEAVGDDPEQLQLLLEKLHEWRVLESRAIMEIIQGRLGIVERFERMVLEGAPETASSKTKENLHDLIAGYPWLLEPEWQILAEERTITRQLEEWGNRDIKEGRERYDFLALTGDRELVVVEIKNGDHAVTLKELQRLETYASELGKARPNVTMMLVGSGKYDLRDDTLGQWQRRTDIKMTSWRDVITRTRRYYEHYGAVLRGEVDDPAFARKKAEVVKSKGVLAGGTVHRGPSERKKGLGGQDVEFQERAVVEGRDKDDERGEGV